MMLKASILFLFSVGPQVWAQSPVACDPVAAERACYSSICSQDTFFPRDGSALQEEMQGLPLPEGMQEEFNNYRSALIAAGSAMQGPVMKETIDDLVKDLITSEAQFEEFVAGDVRTFAGQYVRNDLGSENFPSEAVDKILQAHNESYKHYNEFLADCRAGRGASNPAAILTHLDDFQSLMGDSPFYTDRIRNIRSQVTSGQPVLEDDFLNLRSLDLVKSDRYRRMQSLTGDFEQLVRWKVEKLKTTDWAEVARRNQDGCMMVHYLGEKVRRTNTAGKAEQLVNEAIANLETHLLSKLSISTAKAIRKKITPEAFDFGALAIAPEFRFSRASTHTLAARISFLDTNGGATCMMPGLLDDQYSGASDRIKISPVSLAMGSGASVVAHEIGHAINDIFQNEASKDSKAKYDALIACLRSFHPGDIEAGTYEDHTLKTGEDFADWVAASIGMGNHNLFCEMHHLALLRGKTLSAYQSLPGDPHSGHLFRALHTKLINNEPIDQSCKDLMGVNAERPKKCTLD
jgi:hypothetical protein